MENSEFLNEFCEFSITSKTRSNIYRSYCKTFAIMVPPIVLFPAFSREIVRDGTQTSLYITFTTNIFYNDVTTNRITRRCLREFRKRPSMNWFRDSLYRIYLTTLGPHTYRDNIRNTTHFNHIANKTFFTRLYTYARVYSYLYTVERVVWNISSIHDSVSDWEKRFDYRRWLLIGSQLSTNEKSRLHLGTLKFRLLRRLIACK